MEPDRIRKMAVEELDEALVRFWARVGNLPDVNEHFAAALASWLSEWTESYLLPEGPEDPEYERTLRERVERARRDLELREPREGTDDA